MGALIVPPPESFDMTMTSSLTLYDNYTRTMRAFEPLKAGAVGLYTCGPTVYDYQHIGNFRTFLFEDVLKRVLEWNRYTVTHVMNITVAPARPRGRSPRSTPRIFSPTWRR
jgi:hypothetical protein